MSNKKLLRQVTSLPFKRLISLAIPVSFEYELLASFHDARQKFFKISSWTNKKTLVITQLTRHRQISVPSHCNDACGWSKIWLSLASCGSRALYKFAVFARVADVNRHIRHRAIPLCTGCFSSRVKKQKMLVVPHLQLYQLDRVMRSCWIKRKPRAIKPLFVSARNKNCSSSHTLQQTRTLFVSLNKLQIRRGSRAPMIVFETRTT